MPKRKGGKGKGKGKGGAGAGADKPRPGVGKAGKKKVKRKNEFDDGAGSDTELNEGSATQLNVSVDRDLRALKAAQLEQDDAPEEEAPAQAKDGEDEEIAPTDPYLLADATYIQKDTRWRNKQRTLVMTSRGVASRFRHLSEDIKKLLPHHKGEPKFDKSSKLHEINEVAELKSCNNVVFFEARKGEDLYMWLARVPFGPTVKFQVHNIHTTGEVRLAGNCLLGSRPVLHFDKPFNDISYLKLMKGLLTQAFGTPRNHPKSKPFHDHMLSFYYLDKKIWCRHYQIAPELPHNENDPEKQVLTEIGPRFVLDPITILSGSFSGQKLYQNPFYMSPTALRVQAKKLLGNPYKRRLEVKDERKQLIKDNELEEDPLDEAFL